MARLKKAQIEEITEMGKLQFTPAELERILAIKGLAAQIETPGTAAHEAYDRGLLLAQAEVRATILKQSKQGSSPAQKQFLQFTQDRDRKTRRKP